MPNGVDMARFYLAPARRRLALLLALVVAGLWSSAADASDLTGSWRGSWISCTTGHKGTLIAEFRQINSCQYEVVFRGTFFKILPFRYAVTLDVVGYDGETTYLAGSADLGRLFGVFHYRAQANACCFTADYTSCKDQGRFEMTRSCPHRTRTSTAPSNCCSMVR